MQVGAHGGVGGAKVGGGMGMKVELVEENDDGEDFAVSKRRYRGTDWYLIKTANDKKFYYHAGTNASTWEKPLDLPKKGDNEVNGNHEVEVGGSGLDGQGKEEERSESSDDSSDEEEEEGGKELTPAQQLLKAVSDFEALLAEKKIRSFTPWEKALPLLIQDRRFTALPMGDRRRMYDVYMKKLVETERVEKKDELKTKMGAFKEVVESHAHLIEEGTNLNDFLLMRDERGTRIRYLPATKALDTPNLLVAFNSAADPIKKRRREGKARVEQGVVSLLTESGVEGHARWEEWEKNVMRKVKEIENEGYRMSRAEAEALFRQHCASIRHRKDERQLKREREEDILRQREKAVRREMMRDEKERERTREKVAREEAEMILEGLFAERIQTVAIDFDQALSIVKKDVRYTSAMDMLSEAEKEAVLNRRLRKLKKEAVASFHRILQRLTEGEFWLPFSSVRSSLDGVLKKEQDMTREEMARAIAMKAPRLTLPSSEWEGAYSEWVEVEEKAAKAALFNLLDEKRVVSRQDIEKIGSLVKGDPRYRRLDGMAEVRERWVEEALAGRRQ